MSLPSLGSGIVEGTVLGALKASTDPEELRADWAALGARLAFYFSVIYLETPESSSASCCCFSEAQFYHLLNGHEEWTL